VESKKISPPRKRGKSFIVPSLFNLIALKLHSIKHNPKIREQKDFPDIVNLININKVNVEKKDFRELCLKYGTEGMYNNTNYKK